MSKLWRNIHHGRCSVLSHQPKAGPRRQGNNTSLHQEHAFPLVPREYVVEEILKDSLQLPRKHAAQLLWSSMTGDYRSIIFTITVPTLCIGGLQSHIPLECMSWIASEIANAELTLVPGKHYMFIEDPQSFNLAISDFFESSAVSARAAGTVAAPTMTPRTQPHQAVLVEPEDELVW